MSELNPPFLSRNIPAISSVRLMETHAMLLSSCFRLEPCHMVHHQPVFVSHCVDRLFADWYTFEGPSASASSSAVESNQRSVRYRNLASLLRSVQSALETPKVPSPALKLLATVGAVAGVILGKWFFHYSTYRPVTTPCFPLLKHSNSN